MAEEKCSNWCRVYIYMSTGRIILRVKPFLGNQTGPCDSREIYCDLGDLARSVTATDRRFIPSASYQLHVVHCARNMVLCKQCDEPIPRSEFEDHMEECPMTKVECVCGKMIEKCKLETHKAEECPKRTTLCKWCATHVEMGNLEEHEDYCGSRTEKCEKCGEFIMLKNFETHLQTNCAPKPSWERKSSIVSSTPSYSSYTSSIKPSTITDSATSIPTPSYDAYSSSRRFSSSTISATSALRRSSSISRVTSSSLSRSATAAEVVTNSIVTDNNSSDDVVMIPCEFCDKPISSTKLLSHQAECVNPTNVRSVASTSTSNTSSSYSSRFTRASSISRSYSLTSTNSSSKIHKQVQQTETANTTSDTSSVNSRKTLATSSSSSIVNRYLSSPEPKTNGSKKYLPESPPSYEKDFGSSSYVGRSSYLVEESRREDRSSYSSYKSTETKTREKTEAPGMYTNDNDREGLRQMLSSLRRDPMDVEDDPDNNDGSFFPCEFCGDPYPCEFLMRHQISCDLNPQPVSSGSGFDYSAIKRNIGDHLGVPEPSYNRRRTSATSNGNSSSSNGDAGEQYTSNSRESRRLSRSNSVIERSYSRSNVRKRS